MKLAEAYDVLAKNSLFHSSQGSAALKEARQVGDQNALQREKTIENMRDDDCHAFLTILDNVSMLVSHLAVKSELAGLTLNKEASQKEWKVVRKMTQQEFYRGVLAVVRALQEIC
jgi:hypothetical protein